MKRLGPWHGNQGKRLVKSPKILIRDSGLLHGRAWVVADYEAPLGVALAGVIELGV